MDNHYDRYAVIIGGGIAGMTAALHLAERGLKPLILESGERHGKIFSARAIGCGMSRLPSFWSAPA